MKNNFYIVGDSVIISLNRRDGNKLTACISIKDFEKVNSFQGTWCAQWNPCIQSFYCVGTLPTVEGVRTRVYLHRWIMDCPNDRQVDHINGEDTLNCRRENLRIVKQAENAQNRSKPNQNNTSGIQGVSRYKRNGKWRADIYINGKQIHLGCFTDIKKAEDVIKAARAELMPYSKEAQNLKNVL